MGFSAMLLRRWIFRSGAAGISRSRRSAIFNHFPCGLAAANRMISSSTSGSESAPRTPWMVMRPRDHRLGLMYHFLDITKNEFSSVYSDECSTDLINNLPKDGITVGSSHGWLALYEFNNNHRLLLLDPTTNRLFELPPADSVVHSLVIGEENGHLAFITLGDGDRLAFFSRRRRCFEWFPLLNPKKTKTKGRVYESLVYSSRHSRLFCLTEEKEEEDNLELECWDLSDELGSPSVETMELDLDFPPERDPAARKLKYVLCVEEEVYVVVRHVVANSECFCPITTYNTVGMDVYRIERESGRGKAVRMEDSLEGLAMFIGNNQPVAIRAAEHANVKPNSIYITSDSRLKNPNDELFEGRIFDYEKKDLLPLQMSHIMTYSRPLPIWYTPPSCRSGESPSLLPPPVLKGGDLVPDDDAELVGFSHGWVALLNRRNNDLFLSDPRSHRHIKLPPIDALPDPYFNLDLDGRGSVSKLILSASPDDDEDCRAVMSFGPAKRLAFCLPGRSSEWTPIGDLFLEKPEVGPVVACARVHEDLVYCSRRKVFTSVSPCTLTFPGFLLEDNRYDKTVRKLRGYNSESWDWDIEDPASAKLVRTAVLNLYSDRGPRLNWLEENREILEKQCLQIPHLVYAEESDQPFLVLRFVMLMNPHDGGRPLGYIPRCEVKGLSEVFPCKTFGFIVMRMDEDKPAVYEYNSCTLLDDLNGMSMVVGIDQSVAISSSTELKPNCIYFSDAKSLRMVCGVNDSGIFDYENKIIISHNDFKNYDDLKTYDHSPSSTSKAYRHYFRGGH